MQQQQQSSQGHRNISEQHSNSRNNGHRHCRLQRLLRRGRSYSGRAARNPKAGIGGEQCSSAPASARKRINKASATAAHGAAQQQQLLCFLSDLSLYGVQPSRMQIYRDYTSTSIFSHVCICSVFFTDIFLYISVFVFVYLFVHSRICHFTCVSVYVYVCREIPTSM